MADSSNNSLQCVVVTPEETAVDTTADSLSVPLFDGELGVLRNHAPMIGRLGYGELRIKSGSETTRLFVDGGFVQIADNVVSVMTNRAKPIEEIDAQAAQKDLEAALATKASGEEAVTLRQRDIDRARGALRVAMQSR